MGAEKYADLAPTVIFPGSLYAAASVTCLTVAWFDLGENQLMLTIALVVLLYLVAIILHSMFVPFWGITEASRSRRKAEDRRAMIYGGFLAGTMMFWTIIGLYGDWLLAVIANDITGIRNLGGNAKQATLFSVYFAGNKVLLLMM